MSFQQKFNKSALIDRGVVAGVPSLMNEEAQDDGGDLLRLRRSYLLFDPTKTHPREVTLFGRGTPVAGGFYVQSRRINQVGDHLFTLDIGTFGVPGGGGSGSLLSEDPTEASSGFDSLTSRHLVAAPNALAVPALARGTAYAPNLYVVSSSSRRIVTGWYIRSTQSMGLLSPSGARVTYSSSPSRQQGENVLVDGTIYRRVTTQEATPTIEIEEIVTGEIKGDIATGIAEEPPAFAIPPDPVTVWNFLADPTYAFPNGWIRQNVGAQGLRGTTGVWLRRTQWQWVHAFNP